MNVFPGSTEELVVADQISDVDIFTDAEGVNDRSSLR